MVYLLMPLYQETAHVRNWNTVLAQRGHHCKSNVFFRLNKHSSLTNLKYIKNSYHKELVNGLLEVAFHC
jgi:hypothetical protein